MSKWPIVAIGDVFEIARGGSPRPIDAYITTEPDGVNWILISDASGDSKYITATKKRIRKDGVQRSRMVQPGDLVLTNSMSFGRPYIMRTSGCIHDGWLVLTRRKDNVDSDFFYYLLGSKAIYSEFKRRAAGATVKNLNIELVRGVQVPLPPMIEQRRIAEVLDRTEDLRAKRRAALAQAETLDLAIFLDMFGDPVTNPKGWSTVALEDLTATSSGGTPNRSEGAYFGGGIPWVKSGELHQGVVTVTEETLTQRGLAESSAKLKPPGTVLVAMYGATVGTVGILGIEAATNQAICCIQTKTGLDADYLVTLLRRLSPMLLARRVGGAQPNLSQEFLRTLRIPIPPYGIQRDFARKLAAVENLKVAHRAGLIECDALCGSLQYRAFRGEL